MSVFPAQHIHTVPEKSQEEGSGPVSKGAGEGLYWIHLREDREETGMGAVNDGNTPYHNAQMSTLTQCIVDTLLILEANCTYTYL